MSTVTPNADLGIATASAPTTGLPGRRLDYTFTVTNSGPGPARAQVEDVLPADTAFVSASSGCSLVATTIRCALGTLVCGASVLVTVSLVVSPISNATSTRTRRRSRASTSTT